MWVRLIHICKITSWHCLCWMWHSLERSDAKRESRISRRWLTSEGTSCHTVVGQPASAVCPDINLSASISLVASTWAVKPVNAPNMTKIVVLLGFYVLLSWIGCKIFFRWHNQSLIISTYSTFYKWLIIIIVIELFCQIYCRTHTRKGILPLIFFSKQLLSFQMECFLKQMEW